ncbi:MAG TPA: ABC transporter substrate-binding protein [Geminicoccaceae bacterium]
MPCCPPGLPRRNVLRLLAVSALAATPVSAAEFAAGPPDAGAMVLDFARRLGAALAAAERTGEPAAVAIGPVLGAHADLPRIGRLVLGRHWRTAATAERARYLDLFSGHLAHLLARQLSAGARDGLDPDRLQLVAVYPAGAGGQLVRTRLDRPDAPALAIDWQLRPDDEGQLRVIDLTLGGVSMLLTQRAEVAAVVERQGIEGLLDTLAAAREASRSQAHASI